MKNNIILTDYQQKAVNDMTHHAVHFLSTEGTVTPEITLKSVTGSGKTVIATALMEEICNQVDGVGFLWASVAQGGINAQSYESIIDKTSELNVKRITSEGGAFLGSGMLDKEVYAVSWDSLAGSKCLLTRSDALQYNFYHFLDKSRDNGTKIVLIIDESHLNAGKNTQTAKVKSEINADLIINISATPTRDQTTGCEVDTKEVIDSGFIKKSIRYGNNIDFKDPQGDIHALIYAANERREYLKKLYSSNINPLVLIAIPNGKDGNEMRPRIEKFMEDLGKTYENGKLGIHLTGAADQINSGDSLKEDDNKVEFIIFKNAFNTGWDCPRAQILVKLKSIKSESFSTQLMGRILRMPEREHYNNDDLNHAYLYTNETNPKFEESFYPKANIKTKIARLKSNVSLDLVKKRLKIVKRGQVYIPVYKPLLIDALDKIDLDYNVEGFKKEVKLIKSGHIQIEKGFISVGKEKENIDMSDLSIGHEVLAEIKPILKDNGISATTSFSRVATMITNYISDKKGWDVIDGRKPGLVILKNTAAISTAIADSLKIYFDDLQNEFNKRQYKISLWSPKEDLFFSDDVMEAGRWPKYAYDKTYFEWDSRSEEEYANKLEDDDNVEWWLKNGRGTEDFSIPYGTGKNFFPDFIIKYKSGEIKITEIKGGHVHEEAKKEALDKYGFRHNILTEYILDGTILPVKEFDSLIEEDVLEEASDEDSTIDLSHEEEIEMVPDWMGYQLKLLDIFAKKHDRGFKELSKLCNYLYPMYDPKRNFATITKSEIIYLIDLRNKVHAHNDGDPERKTALKQGVIKMKEIIERNKN